MKTQKPDGVSKKMRLPKELTFQDMYNNQDAFDDEEEDDSDWEPVQKHIEILKWFCSNCTMVNLDDVAHCDICGEHKESGILRHGFYASPCSPEVDLIQAESEVRGRDKDFQSETSASNCSTAVGFDERMLLHFRAAKFSPDFTIISAGFDAAHGDPLGCCDVTPAGYAQMTHMLSTLFGGKLLVILEGGFVVYSLLFGIVRLSFNSPFHFDLFILAATTSVQYHLLLLQ